METRNVLVLKVILCSGKGMQSDSEKFTVSLLLDAE
jgi:hypothetical protein